MKIDQPSNSSINGTSNKIVLYIRCCHVCSTYTEFTVLRKGWTMDDLISGGWGCAPDLANNMEQGVGVLDGSRTLLHRNYPSWMQEFSLTNFTWILIKDLFCLRQRKEFHPHWRLWDNRHKSHFSLGNRKIVPSISQQLAASWDKWTWEFWNFEVGKG